MVFDMLKKYCHECRKFSNVRFYYDMILCTNGHDLLTQKV